MIDPAAPVWCLHESLYRNLSFEIIGVLGIVPTRMLAHAEIQPIMNAAWARVIEEYLEHQRSLKG